MFIFVTKTAKDLLTKEKTKVVLFSRLEAVTLSLSSLQEACDERSSLTWEMQLISERESKFLTL